MIKFLKSLSSLKLWICMYQLNYQYQPVQMLKNNNSISHFNSPLNTLSLIILWSHCERVNEGGCCHLETLWVINGNEFKYEFVSKALVEGWIDRTALNEMLLQWLLLIFIRRNQRIIITTVYRHHDYYLSHSHGKLVSKRANFIFSIFLNFSFKFLQFQQRHWI